MLTYRQLCAIVLCSLVGCGSARLVHRTQRGGSIALHGDADEAMKHARQMMLDHCRGPYQIVEEGETVVGQTTTTQDETFVADDGTEVTTSGTRTANETEWRIRYVCGEGTGRGGTAPGSEAAPPSSDGYPAPPATAPGPEPGGQPPIEPPPPAPPER